MTKIRIFGLVLTLAILDSQAARAAILYVLGHGPDAILARDDTSTSAVTVVGATGVNVAFGDLAASPAAGLAYMTDGRQLGAANSSLFTLNLATGAATLIGNTGIPDLFGLAYDPDTSTLFGTTYSEGKVGLYSINMSTGAATFIGPTQDPSIPNSTREVDALTYNTKTHSLVGISAGYGNLYTIDETTGALTLQASLQPSGLSINHNLGDLAYDAASNLYYSDDSSSGAGFGHIYRTDPSQPVFNDVAIINGLGADTQFGVDGILVQDSAHPVPEPSTFVVASILAGVFGFRRLRRRRRTTSPSIV